MAITLEELKIAMNDKVFGTIVDTFLRESEILQLMTFDDSVSPSGGSTLTYGYTQTKLPSTAAFRALNSEYTSNHATIEKKTVDLKVFGGSYEIDRVLKEAEGKFNNMAFQIEQKIRAAVSLFHYTMINGNAATASAEFDGLDKMLVGTTTEFGTEGFVDLATATNLKANADEFYEALQVLINTTGAGALLMNTAMFSKIQTVARVLGYKTETEEAFGRKVMSMDGVRFVDLKNHYTVSESAAVANAIVKKGISRRAPSSASTETDGLTDIYAVKFDLNEGFHGATLTNGGLLKQFLPDFSTPGAVKKGEVEMVAATALKNTAHAGVLRNVKIA